VIAPSQPDDPGGCGESKDARHAVRNLIHDQGLEALSGYERIGHVTFLYDAGNRSFKPPTNDPAVMRTSCHSCHSKFVKARDDVFTSYAKR
jgi:hypothetical protein